MEREQIYDELKKCIINSEALYRIHIEILEEAIKKAL